MAGVFIYIKNKIFFCTFLGSKKSTETCLPVGMELLHWFMCVFGYILTAH